jgi:hypothetical protein
MINLDTSIHSIEQFIQDSFDRFKHETNNIPNSIGVYCCPWSGWISTHFNVNKNLSETLNNCPDFEIVEYDLLELDGWQQEYESETPTFLIKGEIVKLNHALGDINELIFQYLEPIVKRLKETNHTVFLLQMLDSSCIKVF